MRATHDRCLPISDNGTAKMGRDASEFNVYCRRGSGLFKIAHRIGNGFNVSDYLQRRSIGTGIKACFLITATAVAFFIGAASVTGQQRNRAADDLQRLRTIESSVKSIAIANRDACVAISDGIGIGSGVIVSASGIVLTAGHVMGTDEKEYEVLMRNGKTVIGRPLGKNLDVDAGMLQLDGDGWPHVELGSTTGMKDGDWVVSLGHSGGFELGREPPVRTGRLLRQKGHQITTDAVLIGGDSGGPLFDLDGKLIAIHSSIGDSVAENRHVRIEQFKKDWQQLQSGKTWGRLPELASNEPPKAATMGVKLDLTHPRARIKLVKPNSAAARTGLQQNDIVIGFDGQIIDDGRSLIAIVKQFTSGDACFMTILRNNVVMQLEIKLD